MGSGLGNLDPRREVCQMLLRAQQQLRLARVCMSLEVSAQIFLMISGNLIAKHMFGHIMFKTLNKQNLAQGVGTHLPHTEIKLFYLVEVVNSYLPFKCVLVLMTCGLSISKNKKTGNSVMRRVLCRKKGCSMQRLRWDV